MKLIFLADKIDEWTIKGYHVGIWNNSDYTNLYFVTTKIKGKTSTEKRGEINPKEIKAFSYIDFSDISLEPEFVAQFWPQNKDQSASSLNSVTKLKAKQFFKKLELIPGTNTEAIVYDLAHKKIEKKTDKEDLAEYTINNLSHNDYAQEEVDRIIYSTEEFDLAAKLNFKNEIDLHVDKLSLDHHKLSKQEKYLLQIKCAENFVEDAAKAGVNRIYLIHGIGKGKLKDGINELLHKHPRVKRYKNEYHHKYGYGATEVELR